MSKNLRDYTAAIYGMDAVVQRTPADRWGAASPCDGWSARDVVIHQIGVFDGVAAMARTGEIARPTPPADVDDLLTEWARSRAELLEALDQPDVLHRPGDFWFGTTSIEDLLAVVMYDPLAHAWDLATAVGIDHHCSAEVASAALVTIERLAPTLREHGLIGEPVVVAADADPVTKFLALVGRNPTT
jgi:uncharacterized protein (TIGR03086 family)